MLDVSRRTVKVAISVGLVAAMTGISAAQALIVARRKSEIGPFGMVTYLRPDWGANPNVGFSIGVDSSPLIPLWIQPSIETRFTDTPGPIATEKTISGGLKLAVRLPRVHPYGTVAEGLGLIYFTHPEVDPLSGRPYLRDASRIYTAGGGAEIDISPLWKMRIDYSEQLWNLKPPRIRPIAVSFGFAYRIPFPKGKMT